MKTFFLVYEITINKNHIDYTKYYQIPRPKSLIVAEKQFGCFMIRHKTTIFTQAAS